MSYKDYIKKKKDYSGVLRDSSEREIKVEQTKQAQANRPVGPRQAYTAPKEKESIVDKFHKKYNEIRNNEKTQAVGSVLDKTKKAYIGSNPILNIPFKIMEKGDKTAQNIANITSNSKITGGFVDKGALENGATGENLYKTVKATGLDVGKQALKGSIVEGGEGLGDLVSVVKDVLSKNEKPSKELERANEEKAEEITNAILAHGKGTARYLNPLNVAKDYYEMFKSRFSGNNDFQEKARERYEDDKAYFAALEEESALGNEGEAVVGSSAKSARQGFIDTTTGIPWELQMAGEVLPQTYLNERVNKGNSKGKALLHSAVDVGNEIIWENVFDGFNLPRTGKTIDNVLDAGINKIGDATTRTALKTGKRVVGEGAEEYGGDITGNALHWAIDNWGQMDGKEYAQGILNTMKETATSDEALKSGLSGMLSSGLYEVGTGGQYSRQQYQTEKMTQNIIEDQQLTKAQKNTIIEALTEDETKSYKSIKEIQEAIINSKLDHTKKASLAAVLEQQGYKVENIINDVIEHSDLSEKQRESLQKYLKEEKRSAQEIAMAITLAEARNSIIEDDFIEKYKAEKKESIRNKMLETYKKSDFYNPETSLLNNKLLTENNFDFRNYTMDELSRLVDEKGKTEILEEFDKQKWDVNQKLQRAKLESDINKIITNKNIENDMLATQAQNTKNVETAENQPSTIENKALSEDNQQTIQEENKTSENATSQETEGKMLSKGKKKSKLLNIKSSENITSQEVEQSIKNYLENNEILSEKDLDEKIKTEKDAKELERLQGLKDKIAEMRNSVAENNTIKETSKQNQRKSEILETIGKTEEEWNKMSQYGKERTLDNFSLDEITDEDRSLMLEENVVNNEKIEKVDEDLNEIKENSISNINEKKRGLLLSNLENPNASKRFKKATKKSLQKDIGSYIVQTNERTMRKAQEAIANNDNGFDDAYTTFTTKVKNNEKISLDDMAQGLLMIQHYDYIGDTKKAQKILEDMSVVATETGQMIQILSLLKKVRPQARADIARRLVERYNKKYSTDIKINEELMQKLEKEKDSNKADEIFSEVLEDAINQTPLTWGERLDNWRFMSMLTNLKTWGRNSLGNTVNRQVYKVKNLTKGLLEDLTGIAIKGVQAIKQNMGKETSFNYIKDTSFYKIPTKSQKDFARTEAERLGSQIDNTGSKYSNNPENQMKALKRKFDTKILNDIANFTEGVLEKADTKALMKMYSNALAHYMAVNNLTREDFEVRDGDSQKIKEQKEVALARASEYAAWQAKEATFHQANALATWLNNLDRMTEITGNKRVDATIKAGGTLAKGLLPFRRTPFNMVSQSINFSPVGILRGGFGFAHDVIKDGNKLKQELKEGKITQEQFDMEFSENINYRLDQISKGVTGTLIEGILGYFLASVGIISAGNSDDEDKYEEQLGKQQYSLNILGHSFTLDFLAPAITPLFYGAEFYNAFEQNPEASWFTNAGVAGRKSLNVLYNTTMLSSINNAFKYADGIDDAIGVAISSYLGQFVPSMFTNFANTIYPERKNMSAQNQGIVGDFEYLRNRVANLMPRRTCRQV